MTGDRFESVVAVVLVVGALLWLIVAAVTAPDPSRPADPPTDPRLAVAVGALLGVVVVGVVVWLVVLTVKGP